MNVQSDEVVVLPEVSARNTGQDSDRRKSAVNFMVLVVGLSFRSRCCVEEIHGGHGRRKVPIAAARRSARNQPCFTAIARDGDPEQGRVWRCPCAEAPVEGAALNGGGGKEEEEKGGRGGRVAGREILPDIPES